MTNDPTTPNTFADPMQFDLQRAQLQRRRRLAEELLSSRIPVDATLGPKGRALFGAGPGGAIASGIDSVRGQLEAPMLDREEMQLGQQEQAQQQRILNSIPASGPERQQALLSAAQKMPSLRNSIAALLAADERSQIADANRMEKSEQDAANRVEKANSEERYRRTFEQQLALKQAPTSHITIQTGNAAGGNAASSNANPFAGTSTQVGVDRDGNPVYRVSKSGSIYRFDENGQPTAHEGVILPKPAAAKEPTESERSSAGYLGRMEAAEKNLGGAQPLPLAQQKGMQVAPSLTNYTLTPAQQVTRQQQEDFVRAKLRKESGAVIGKEEMDAEIRTYFPQAGDSPAVQQQKTQSRAQALEQMRSSAGRAPARQAPPVPTAATVVREVKLKDGRIGVEYSDGSRGFK